MVGGHTCPPTHTHTEPGASSEENEAARAAAPSVTRRTFHIGGVVFPVDYTLC